MTALGPRAVGDADGVETGRRRRHRQGSRGRSRRADLGRRRVVPSQARSVGGETQGEVDQGRSSQRGPGVPPVDALGYDHSCQGERHEKVSDQQRGQIDDSSNEHVAREHGRLWRKECHQKCDHDPAEDQSVWELHARVIGGQRSQLDCIKLDSSREQLTDCPIRQNARRESLRLGLVARDHAADERCGDSDRAGEEAKCADCPALEHVIDALLCSGLLAER